MKSIINEVYQMYEPLNGNLYMGLYHPDFIDYNNEEKIIIGFEDLGGEKIYIDLLDEANSVMMEAEYFGPMKVFNNINEFKEFINTILELKSKNSTFDNEEDLNKYLKDNIDTYDGTDENLLISSFNYLKS